MYTKHVEDGQTNCQHLFGLDLPLTVVQDFCFLFLTQ